MNTTIRDVARKAGVSDTTVSLAFREISRISDRTRKRVLSAASELNYVPNQAAKLLRAGESRTIGFLVNDITNPFYALMIQQAQEVAESRGYSLFVADSRYQPDKEIGELGKMVQSRVQGALLCLCERSPQSLAVLERSRVPFIVLDTYPPGYQGSYVVNDLLEAGRMAGDHLADVGCQTAAFLTAEPSRAGISAFVKLQEGFVRALRDRGLPAPAIIPAGMTISAGEKAFEELLRAAPNVDGVLCANDLCAMGVIEAADRRGIRIGKQLRVIGIDDIEMAAVARVSLTSIDQPHEKIARLAMHELIDSIERDVEPSIHVMLKPNLIIRRSTQSSS